MDRCLRVGGRFYFSISVAAERTAELLACNWCSKRHGLSVALLATGQPFLEEKDDVGVAAGEKVLGIAVRGGPASSENVHAGVEEAMVVVRLNLLWCEVGLVYVT